MDVIVNPFAIYHYDILQCDIPYQDDIPSEF